LHKSSKDQKQAYPVILVSNIQYRKAIDWLVKSIQLRKESHFFIRLSNEIKNITFFELTNSLIKKKEYYNYAVLFKSTRKYK
jgi:ribosomal protein S7